MAKIKCPECGSEIDENVKFCPNCGHRMQEEKNLHENEERPKKSSKKTKKWIIAGVAIVAGVAIGIGIFVGTSDMREYDKANELYKQKKYAEAAEAYKNADNYKDSAERAAEADVKAIYYDAKQLYQDKKYSEAAKKFSSIDYLDSKDMADKSTHLDAVQHDKNAPVISGIDDGSKIDITCGTQFNLNEYLKDKIKITDDVSENITDYKVSGDTNIYDSNSGSIDTEYYGKFDFQITAQDEAKNKSSLNMELSLNPIHITKDNRTPVVYDGEYGKISVKSAKHGKEYDSYGDSGYFITFEVENRTDTDMLVCLPSDTSINDYQVNAYHSMNGTVSSGKRGTIENMIYSSDIPSDIGEYNQIDTAACLSEGEMQATYYSVPMIIDANI